MRHIKLFISSLILFLAVPCFAQDLRPSAYVGKPGVVTVRGGKVMGSTGGVTTISGVDITPANSSTTYIYLDLSSTPTVVSNTTGFPTSNYFPICTVIKDANGVITSFTDNRPDSFMAGGGGGGGGGLSFVQSGLIAQCPMTETSGTTISCGAGGTGTLGSSAPASRFNPLFVSVPGIGNIQAMDGCTDVFNTQGHWTVMAGSFSSSAALACGASGVDGSSNAYAVYTGIPTSAGIGQNQFCEVTQQQAPTTGYIGCLLRFQTSATNGYVCYIDNGGSAHIATVTAGVLADNKTLAGQGALVSGDVLACTIQENAQFTGGTISIYKNGTFITSVVVATAATFGWNGQTGMFAHLTSASSGRMSFATGYNLDTTTSGGLAFGGGQQVTLPASLNSAQTIQVFACFQASNTSNLTNELVGGDGGGAASNAIGLMLNGAATADTLQGPTSKIYIATPSGGTGTMQGESLQGCGVVSATFGTAPALDRIYINNQETGSYGQNIHGSSAGLQTTGNYQIGGNPANFGFGGQDWYNGIIYYVLMYNRVLAPSEIFQNYYAMQQAMQARGVNVSVGNLSNCDAVVAMGDSQTTGSGLASPTTQAWPQNIFLFSGSNQNVYCNCGKAYNSAVGGTTVGSAQSTITAAQTPFAGGIPDYYCDPFFTGNGTRNICVLWMGTNDLQQTGTTTGVGSNILQADVINYLKARRLTGWKTIFVDMISRGASGACTFDGNKNAFNPLVRLSWPKFTDGFVDLASDPAFADGSCTGNTFQADNIHPSVFGHQFIAHDIGREINAVFGNGDWTSATTYTATSTAATATTAGSSSGQTATITMAATQPWAAGQCVIVAGVTPAGYNTAANQCALVLTASSTQITYITPGSNLGAITVQGTVQAPQELDQDVYAILGGSATTPNHILQSCLGRTGHTIYRMHTNSTSPWTVTSQFGETINGGATFTMPTAAATNHPIVSFTAVLTSNTAGGCTWHAAW